LFIHSSENHDSKNFGIHDVAPVVRASEFLFETAQQIALEFDENISASLSAGDLLVQNLTTSQSIAVANFTYDTNTNLATAQFGQLLPDGNYRVTLPAGSVQDPGGNMLALDYTFDFFVLAGDANRDRKVDVADLGVLASNWQQSPRTFSQGNFDYSPDGLVDVADLGILASQWQQSLSEPSAASSARRSGPVRGARLIDQVSV
jgi:hypothetical protein